MRQADPGVCVSMWQFNHTKGYTSSRLTALYLAGGTNTTIFRRFSGGTRVCCGSLSWESEGSLNHSVLSSEPVVALPFFRLGAREACGRALLASRLSSLSRMVDTGVEKLRRVAPPRVLSVAYISSSTDSNRFDPPRSLQPGA